MTKLFSKNDSSFVCTHCGKFVPMLKYTSRDHCPFCLVSLHVDITPGDRQNSCRGKMFPIGVKIDGKKGRVIEYKCSKCRTLHNNKVASDDNENLLLKVANKSYRP